MTKGFFFTPLLISVFGYKTLTAQVLHADIAAIKVKTNGTIDSTSFSVGQLVYTRATGATSSLTQGVQQPFEINVVSGIEYI